MLFPTTSSKIRPTHLEPTIEAYQVQHLPIVKAYADKIGLVEAIKEVVPTEMAIDPGTIVLGMILDTVSGRSPLYRLEEFFTHQDAALLLGSECGRFIAEAVAHNTWEDIGVLAHTKPTTRRPATAYKVYEGEVVLYGSAYRAVVVHSSAQDKRRQQRLEREIQASYSTIQTTTRTAEQQEYFCRADAEAAAAQLRAVPTTYHLVDVTAEERPVYGRGRPSAQKPRPVKALRYRLKTTIRPHTARLGRMEAEAGCFVLLTNVPTAGNLAPSAREILTVYKEQHGTEQNYEFLKDPVLVNSLFLKKPERIEALGLVLLLSLLLWRLMERQMRTHVESTGPPLTGWDKKTTERPTTFMMMTKFAGVLVLKVGPQRQLARPLSAVQQQYLVALRVSATCFTLPAG